MKHRTRIFALFLAFCLLVSLFPAAFAEDGNDTDEDNSALLSESAESSDEAAYSGTCGENLTWTLDSEGLLTISGTGEMQDYINGEQPEWCSLNVLNAEIEPGVTSIGSSAFYDCKDLASITIPEGVTSIGDLAFNNCMALTSVSLPETVTSIGVCAFAGCEGLATINIPEGVTAIGNSTFNSCKSLTSITIPGTVTSIDDYAFAFCYGLTSITIPDSVTSIGSYAFIGCSGLTSVTISEGVSSIGNSVFQSCSALTSITLPESLASMGRDVFTECTALTEIIAAPGNKNYSSVDGVLFNKDKTDLLICPAGKTGETYAIPAGVTSISENAFFLCKFTSITIPESLNIIGENAFSFCKFASITIPDSVTSIGNSAFLGSGLTSITIPNSVTSIGESTFSCTSLTSITIPAGVTSIGNYAFNNCASLTSVTIPASVTSIGSDAFGHCLALKEIIFKGNAPTFAENTFGVQGPSGFTIATAYYPANNDTWTEEVRQSYGGDITWVEAAEADDDNGDDNGDENDDNNEENIIATGSCGENLTWKLDSEGLLTVSGTGEMESVTYNEVSWRAYCDYILSVVIESGVTSIGDYAFNGCASLTSITIPDSVTSIGYAPFSSCVSLTSITIPESVKSIGNYAFSFCTKLTTADIYGGAASIGCGIFRGCKELTSVTFSDELTSIGTETFWCCGNLTNVKLPASLTDIGYQTFWFCESLADIDIPEAVTSIGSSAFGYCSSLNRIALPAALTSIGSGAFSGCASLTELTVAPENEVFSSVDGILFNKDKTVLIFYSAAKAETEYTIPDSVKSIDANAFTACTNLTSISIPDSVTNIGLSAFSGCTALTSINIPDSVTNIDDGAFGGCSALTSIKLSGSLKDIGEGLFLGCNSLKEVTIPSSVTVIYEYAFYRSGLSSINIPGSVESIHAHAFYNCESLNTIVFEGNAPEMFYQTLGNVTATAYYPANNDTWTEQVRQSYDGNITWVEASNKVELDLSEIAEGSSIWVDGIEYNYSDLVGADGKLSLELASADAKAITTYTYKTGDSAHTSYPTGMEVWLLSHDGTQYTAEHVTELDGLLRYSGSSIRVSGEKGIRMITSIDQTLRCTLKDSGVRGYKVVEYGTLLAWASEVPASQLVLGANGVKSNYAYLRDIADPVFAYKDNDIQYTNVITGFTLDQCSPDLVMRPYIKLCDSDGNEAVIYGGVVQRSIGYIAYQNRSSFAPGTNAYEYVWNIIHHVYGDAYDADYEG